MATGGKPPCVCASSCPSKNANATPENWAGVLDDLSSFLNCSADLVKDIKETVKSTEIAPEEKKALEETKAPEAAKLEEKPAVKTEEKKSEAKCICTPSPCDGAKVGKDVSAEKPKDVDRGCASSETIVLEPKYEDFDDGDAPCADTEPAVVKPPPAKPPTKAQKKTVCDNFMKEKTEKLAKLKETVAVAQKNLTDLQEQIRQFDRLFEDYYSKNTPEGQVNPAALYKEIMKPQSVPYIKPSPPHRGPCVCATSKHKSFKIAEQTSTTFSQKNQEKVSILSAVPLNPALDHEYI